MSVVNFPFRRSCPFAPAEQYAKLRAEQPVVEVRLPTGKPAWLITRYEDVRRLLTDPRISSSRDHPNLPLIEPVTESSRRNIAAVGRALVGLDPPEHGLRRRMLIPEFTLRQAQKMRPYLQQVVDTCITQMLVGEKPADLLPALALQVPSLVLCELLGVPSADRGFFERSSTTQLRRNISPEERTRVGAELRGYLNELISAKEADPGDDLLGRLILKNRETGVYDHDMLVWLTMFLLIAGHETTSNMISLAVLTLLRDEPQRRAHIVASPQALDMAVEELLRFWSVVDALPRVATDDIEVGGVTIRRGDGVLISFASANWDDDAFVDAANFHGDKPVRHHVAFGFGVHQCLGQHLAREELRVVLGTLFTRVPQLRLAASVDDLPFKDDSNIYGLDRLPVTW